MVTIPFNKPFISGNELKYIEEAVNSGKISGNGKYSNLSQKYFEDRYKFNKTLLTTSCTDALEMSSILLNIEPGDEVIVPSYTFVSTANAFALRGAKLVFADSSPNNPNVDETKIEGLITKKTKAIVPVHYAGVACEMDTILGFAQKYNIHIVEDAAQAIDSFYKGKALGSLGDLGAFSFHETKNIITGEGGLLSINNSEFKRRAEIIWEKGTNRAEFFRGEVDKYGWVDVGSSFLPSELISAFLYAQLENIDKIQKRRVDIWNRYYSNLKLLEQKGCIKLPIIPDYATNNGHMFYVICESLATRSELINHLKQNNILSVFHYLSLHKSVFYNGKHDGRDLLNADYYMDHLLRLPLFYELKDSEIDFICDKIHEFYR